MTTYRFTVDVSQGDDAHRIKPLNGVNKGPIQAFRYDIGLQGGYSINYTLLFILAGIQSVRTHDSMLDVAHIFRGTSGQWPASGTDLVHGVEAIDEYLQPIADQENGGVLEDAREDFLDAVTNQQMASSVLMFSMKNLGPPFDQEGYIPRLGDCWLYWRPDSAAAADLSANFEYITSGAEESYRSILGSGFELYMRLGESYHGPSYMGSDEDDAIGGKESYAIAAANIVADLAEAVGGAGSPEHPAFVEILNEPDQSGYTGPDDQSSCSEDANNNWTTMNRARTATWCEDYLDLFAHCVDELTTRGIDLTTIGCPGFTSESMRNLVLYQEGIGQPPGTAPNDSKVDQLLRLLLDQHPSAMNFLAFHQYGDLSSAESDVTRLELAQQFPSDVQARVGALRVITDDLGLDTLPVHVNEWHLTGLNVEGYDDLADALTGSFGAAFVSLGLSVMQHPDLGIERAHLYPAYDAHGGHFHWDGQQFFVRPSAFAMRLHAGLRDDLWLPVSARRRSPRAPAGSPFEYPPEGPEDIFEAIEAGHDVVAMASRESGPAGSRRNSVILTNLSEEVCSAVVRFQGLRSGAHTLRTKHIHRDKPGSAVSLGRYPNTHPYILPSFVESIQAFWTYANIDLNPDNGPGAMVVVDNTGESSFGVVLPAHGVMRIDLVEYFPAPGERPRADGETDTTNRGDEVLQVQDEEPHVASSGARQIDEHVPHGHEIPPWYRESIESEELPDRDWQPEVRLPDLDAGNQRRYRHCLAQMRTAMKTLGYVVDVRMLHAFYDYYTAKIVETGQGPAELDEIDWFTWYLTHPM